MIFRVKLGEITVLLDDDLLERATPEHCRDYLKACSDEALRMYEALPKAEVATDTETG